MDSSVRAVVDLVEDSFDANSPVDAADVTVNEAGKTGAAPRKSTLYEPSKVDPTLVFSMPQSDFIGSGGGSMIGSVVESHPDRNTWMFDPPRAPLPDRDASRDADKE